MTLFSRKRPVSEWIIPGLVAFPALLYAAFLISVRMSLVDPDILWHILMGRDICLSGRISMDNPYTWIPGTHWNQHEWLYDIMIYLVSELGTACYLALYSLLLIGLFLSGLRLNRGRIRAAGLYAVFFVLCFTSFPMNFMNRPSYFSSVLLPVLFFLEERCLRKDVGRNGRMTVLFFGVGVFLANFHCGQAMVIGAFLLVRLLSDSIYLLIRRRDAFRALMPGKLIRTAAFLLGLCLNPCGPAQLGNTFLVAGMQSTGHIAEWEPLELPEYWLAGLTVCYLLTIGYTLGRFLLNEVSAKRFVVSVPGQDSAVPDGRRMLSDIISLCAAFVLTLKSQKSTVLLVYLLILIWYPYVEHMIRFIWLAFFGGWRKRPVFPVPGWLIAVAVVLGMIGGVAAQSAGCRDFTDYVDSQRAEWMGDEVLEALRGRNYRLLHGYNLSPFLMWEEIPVCMDTRQQPYASETGDTEILDDVMELNRTDGEAIDSLLEKYDIEAVMVSEDFDIRWYLEREDSFRLTAEDERGNSVWVKIQKPQE